MGEPEKPCPVHVVVEGERRYCEQGPAGHFGTHCGDRREAAYRLALHAWQESRHRG